MNIGGSTGSGTDYSRITGLATGMDTDAMVKQAVAGEQAKIDSVKQSKQILEWQQEAYVEVIKELKDFQSSFIDILAPAETNMMTSGAYSGVKAVSSNEAILSAVAYGGAAKGNYTVEVVEKALTAIKQSSVFSGAAQSTALNTLNGLATGDNIKITVNGKVFDISIDETKTISELVSTIKNTKDTSGKDLGNYINVSFSELTGKLTLETKDTGSIQKLTIEGTASDKLGITTAEITGQDAEVRITAPGESTHTTVTRPSNKFTVDNVAYDLSGAQNGDTATLSIKADAGTQVDKFKKFVAKYNALVEKLNTKITEKKNYSYKPLTDAQKESMKDEEIKRWEEQAKKGLLSRESNLSNLLLQVRQTFYTTVEGAGVSLSDIGITTTSNYKDGGKLQINETKLKDALENRGDLVQKLFTQSSSNVSEKGILQRVKDTFNSYIGSDGLLIKKAGYVNSRWAENNQLSKSIEDRNKSIREMQNRLYDKQERYYKMFAALEKNMNNLNSQSNWLYSQLGTA
jgi:flagellar hook-associated protein 2